MSDADHEAASSLRIASYRTRARQLRALAMALTSQQARTMILETAQDYERMAVSLERQVEAHKD